VVALAPVPVLAKARGRPGRRRRAEGETNITRELVKSLAPKPKAYDVRDSALIGFLVRVQPSGIVTYYVEIARGKRIKLGRAAVLKAHRARDLAERVLGNVANNRDPWDGIRTPTAVAAAPTLGEFVAGTDPEELDVHKWDGDYATWYAANRKAGRAYTENMQRLRTVFRLWWATSITEITPGNLESFKTDRKRKHRNSNATIRRDLSRLRGAFRLARKRGFANDAFEQVELPDVDTKANIRFLHPDERKRLDQALANKKTPPYLRAMVGVSLNTGVRRGELFALTSQNVDLRQKLITIEGQTSKGVKSRHVPLNETARAVLRAWKPRRASGLVFPGRAGKYSTVKKSWRSLLKLAAVKRFRWHDMRHDFASQLVMRGIDLNTVRELLGHSTIATTLRYAHLAPSHKAAAVKVLDPPPADSKK
jgi:site-specific recombinase XerD